MEVAEAIEERGQLVFVTGGSGGGRGWWGTYSASEARKVLNIWKPSDDSSCSVSSSGMAKGLSYSLSVSSMVLVCIV